MSDNTNFTFDYCGKSITLYLPMQEDHIQKQILNSKNFYEIDLLEEIGRLPLKDGIICDIGANIGNHSVYFSSILKRDVFAFEPNKIARDILDKNIELNDLKDKVKVFQVGLGSEETQGSMDINTTNLGASRLNLVPNGDVAIKTLDSYISKNIKVSLLKIDVEGFEIEVLEGAKETIENNKPLIVIETQNHRDFLDINEKLNILRYIPFGQKGATNTVFFIHKENQLSNEIYTYLQRIDNQIYNNANLKRYREIVQTQNKTTAELKEIIETKDKSEILIKSLQEILGEVQKDKTSDIKEEIVQTQNKTTAELKEIIETKDKSEILIKSLQEILGEVQKDKTSDIKEEIVQTQNKTTAELKEIIETKDKSEILIKSLQEILGEVQKDKTSDIKEEIVQTQNKTTAELKEIIETKDKSEILIKSLQEILGEVQKDKTSDIKEEIVQTQNKTTAELKEIIETKDKSEILIKSLQEILGEVQKDKTSDIKEEIVQTQNKTTAELKEIIETKDKSEILIKSLQEILGEVQKDKTSDIKEEIVQTQNKTTAELKEIIETKDKSEILIKSLQEILGEVQKDKTSDIKEEIVQTQNKTTAELKEIIETKDKSEILIKSLQEILGEVQKDKTSDIKEEIVQTQNKTTAELKEIIETKDKSEILIKSLQEILGEVQKDKHHVTSDNIKHLENQILKLSDIKEKELFELRKEIHNLYSNIYEKNLLIVNLKAIFSHEQKHIKDYEKAFTIVRNYIHKLEVRNQKLEKKLSILYSSKTWKISSRIRRMIGEKVQSFEQYIEKINSSDGKVESYRVDAFTWFPLVEENFKVLIKTQEKIASEVSKINITEIKQNDCNYQKLSNKNEPNLQNIYVIPKENRIKNIEKDLNKQNYDAVITMARKTLNNNEKYALNLVMANYFLDSNKIWLNRVNDYLKQFDLNPIKFKSRGLTRFHKLESNCNYQIEEGPLVSIIIPAYNCENTIGTALESLLNQTYKNNEIIVVNDCSDDLTGLIIDFYASKDKRIKVIHNIRNVGPYVSKNYALDICEGEYITGHDSDDWAHPQRIERQVKSLEESNGKAKVCQASLIRMQLNGKIIIGNVTEFSDDGVTKSSPISCMFLSKFLKNELGYWDSVRFGADSELIERCKRVLSPEEFIYSRDCVMFCLELDDSLTSNKKTGIQTSGISLARKNYLKNYKSFHQNLKQKSSFLQFPHYPRRFESLMSVEVDDILKSIKDEKYKNILIKRLEELNEKNIPTTLEEKPKNIAYLEVPNRFKKSVDFIFKNKPLISIVMTAYNTEKYIENSIKSILNQTYKNIELIIIDDASTDKTREIVESMSNIDNRILLYCFGENRGTYWAKNYGISKSKGEIITFMDSDDISDTYRIEKQFLALNQSGVIMTTCNLIRQDEDGNIIEINGVKERRAPISKMFKRQVIKDIGYFDTVRTSADDEFIQRIKLAYGANTIRNVQEVLYYALLREGALTTEVGNSIDLTAKREEGKPFLPPARQNYLDSYQKWHSDVQNRNLIPYFSFPVVRRPFPVYGKLKVANGIYDSNYISVCIASFPPREEKLKKVIMNLRNKVDFIYVYLNNYKEVPEFLHHPRIQVALSSNADGDLRDNGKIYFMDIIPNGYCFTVDDDINYPDDYIERMIRKIEIYERKAIVGIHGTVFAKPFENYFKNRTVYHFKNKLERDVVVNQLGTGTVGFHTSLIRPNLEEFYDVGMADVFMAVIAKKNNIPLICIERDENWLRAMEEDEGGNLYHEFRKNDSKQTKYISKILPFEEKISGELGLSLRNKVEKYGDAFAKEIVEIKSISE